jgi:hypothetical protein
MGMGQVLTASIHLWSGRAESAVEQALAALDTFDAINDDYGRIQAVLPLGRALITAGRVDEGFAVLEKARGALLPSDSSRYVAFSAAGLVGAAVQIGDRDRAAAALAVLPTSGLSSDDLTTAGGGELLASQALLAVQRSRPDEALDLLRNVQLATGERASSGYTGAVAALALAAAGRLDEALASAATVEGDERSTYLDRVWAGLANGSIAARRGDEDAVADTFTSLTTSVDATDDQIAQAVVRLGHATALEALAAGATGLAADLETTEAADSADAALAAVPGGVETAEPPGSAGAADDDGASASPEVAARFAALGIDPYGWSVVLRQAAGLHPPTTAAA